MVWKKKFALLYCLVCLCDPNVSQAFTCSSAFGEQKLSRTRNLTQIYIHRNSQFPLHVDLIHAALLADIMIYRVSVESTYEIEHIARALNSMHQRYNVPVRISENVASGAGGMRYITFDRLKQIVEPMFSSSFLALQNLGLLDKRLSERESHFWRSFQNYFDSQSVRYLSNSYKDAISRPSTPYEELVKIKEDYHDRVISDLFYFLDGQLTGGLHPEERWVLNSILIQ